MHTVNPLSNILLKKSSNWMLMKTKQGMWAQRGAVVHFSSHSSGPPLLLQIATSVARSSCWWLEKMYS